MNKKGSKQTVNAVFGIIITIIIVLFVYNAMIYFFESGRDAQALHAFQEFIEPIRDVCSGDKESYSSDINLRVAGKTYAIAQIYVPPGEGEYFINSNGYIGFNQPPLMKCEGSTCFCLVKMEETEKNLKGKCLTSLGGVAAAISMVAGKWASEAIDLTPQKLLEYAITNAIGCPFWYYEGIDMMQILLTQLSMGQRFTYAFPEYWGGCSASQDVEDLQWALTNYDNSTESRLCGKFIQPHCECWSESGDCSNEETSVDIYCTKTTGAMISSKVVRGITDIPFAVIIPVVMKALKVMIKVIVKIVKFVGSIVKRVVAWWKERGAQDALLRTRETLINSKDGKAYYNARVEYWKKEYTNNPPRPGMGSWDITRHAETMAESQLYTWADNLISAGRVLNVIQDASKSLLKDLHKINPLKYSNPSRFVNFLGKLYFIKYFKEAGSALKKVPSKLKEIFADKVGTKIKSFFSEKVINTIREKIGKDFSAKILRITTKLKNVLSPIAKSRFANMVKQIPGKIGGGTKWVGKHILSAGKHSGISIIKQAGMLSMAGMMELYGSEEIQEEIDAVAKGINIDKEVPAFVGQYVGPKALFDINVPEWATWLPFTQIVYMGLNMLWVYVSEFIPNCVLPLVIGRTDQFTTTDVNDACYVARVKVMITKDVDWGKNYYPVIDTAELWQRRNKIQFMQCIRLDELGCNNFDEDLSENSAVKTNERISCGMEVDMLSAWDFFSWIRYSDCITDPSGSRDITLCYKMDCETYGCMDCPCGDCAEPPCPIEDCRDGLFGDDYDFIKDEFMAAPCDDGDYCMNAVDDNENGDVDELATWTMDKWQDQTDISEETKKDLKNNQLRNFQYWIGARDPWGHSGTTGDISYLKVEKVCADCDYPPCPGDSCEGKLDHVVDIDPWEVDITTGELVDIDGDGEDGEIGDNQICFDDGCYELFVCNDCDSPPCDIKYCENEIDDDNDGEVNEHVDNHKSLCTEWAERGFNSEDTDLDGIYDFCDDDNDADGLPDEQDFMIVITAHGILD